MQWTTRQSGLDRAELATSAAAILTSRGLYRAHGHPYLARGVVGDLAGFAVLGGVVLATGRRPRHEMLLCLSAIGAVYAAGAEWPLALPEPAWWTLFAAGLGGYLAVRRRIVTG